MLHWGITRAVRGVLLLALLAGCSGSGVALPTESPADADSESLDRSHEFVADVRVEVSGAHAFTWEGRDSVSVTRVGAPGIAVNLLAAGFMNPVPVPGEAHARFRWAFDLLETYTDEPGTYTIPVPAEGATAAVSDGVFIFLRFREEAGPNPGWDDVVVNEEYLRPAQPCTLEIGVHEEQGSLHCPDLRSGDGKSVDLRVRWSKAAP